MSWGPESFVQSEEERLFWYLPMAQALQSPLTSRLPTAHFEHSRSTVEEPKKEGYSPAAHGVNAVHVTAF